ncbi:MAG: alpha/beta hydrolase [Pseudomonadaceae bacterium]|nr:alpha/beta hydrolase [Pseudomonadaceae bacterium]
MPLAPEYQAMLEQLQAAPGPSITSMSPVESRALYGMMRPADAAVAIAEVENTNAPGPAGDIPVRIYKPGSDGPHGIVVNFHGGGWVFGDLDTSDNVCRTLASDADCVVVSVDYRLAPEHPYPAAVEDAWAATMWVADNIEALGGNGKIAVTGESAGGNLAAIVARKAAEHGAPAIALQLLMYPVTDADLDRPSYAENGEGYMLEREGMQWFWNHYCPEARRGEADASPLKAESLTGVAPAVVCTAEFDPLRDEGKAYADALEAAGVQTTYRQYDGLVHDFLAMAHVFACSKAAMDDATGYLRDALN